MILHTDEHKEKEEESGVKIKNYKYGFLSVNLRFVVRFS